MLNTRLPRLRTAIVPAAGLGTRLLPATLGLAKELMPLGCHPALCATLLEALAANLEELILVISPGKDDLRRFLSPASWGPVPEVPAVRWLRQALAALRIRFVEQQKPQGVLDAIAQGLALLPAQETCAVLYPDLIHLPDQRGLVTLLAAHAACGGTVYGLYAPSETSALRHGPSARVVLMQEPEAGRPCRIVRVAPGQEPAQKGQREFRTTLGTIHTPALTRALTAVRPAPGTPLDDRLLLPALNRLAQQGELYGVLLPGEVIDIGWPGGYLNAAARFATGAIHLRELST